LGLPREGPEGIFRLETVLGPCSPLCLVAREGLSYTGWATLTLCLEGCRQFFFSVEINHMCFVAHMRLHIVMWYKYVELAMSLYIISNYREIRRKEC
jgi:hypothetical protein